MGRRAGRRYLYLGVPILQVLTVSQLRAVLAHELGHYSRGHTRFGARDRLAVAIRTVIGLHMPVSATGIGGAAT
jgi:Zn-dependent protease with chaperone function